MNHDKALLKFCKHDQSLYELCQKVKKYNSNFNKNLLYEAYQFSKKAHHGTNRFSGEPFFYHPVIVANYIADLGLDEDSVITALLHDVVEDTEISIEDIKAKFGENIASLVEGVTKLSNIFPSANHKKLANFRKLFLATARDIRVMMIKFADRLHNIETMQYVECAETRNKKALETIQIYAPLAELLGFEDMVARLGDGAFKILHPNLFKYINGKIDSLGDITNSIQKLKELLHDNNINAKIKFRKKSVYSTCKKMLHLKNKIEKIKKNTFKKPSRQEIFKEQAALYNSSITEILTIEQDSLFDKIKDILAVRIITNNIPDCYLALGIIHSNYKAQHNYFKDYISSPKVGGMMEKYQSLHTIIELKGAKNLEVQIRTEEMDKNLNDSASTFVHWNYKNPVKTLDLNNYGHIKNKLKELSTCSELKDDDYNQFLKNFQFEISHDKIVCFSPNGESLVLPINSTVLDFAYNIHSTLGNHCCGAIVDNEEVALDYVLSHEQTIEIKKHKEVQVKSSWLKIAETIDAKNHIKRTLKKKERELEIKIAIEQLTNVCSFEGFRFDEQKLEPAIKHFKCKNLQELYHKIGRIDNPLPAINVLKVAYPLFEFNSEKIEESLLTHDYNIEESYSNCINADISPVYLAMCCYPLPGENIIGKMVSYNANNLFQKCMVVHTESCRYDSKNKSIPIVWDEKECEQRFFPACIRLLVHDQVGIMASIGNIIASYGINVTNLYSSPFKGLKTTLIIEAKVKNYFQLKQLSESFETLEFCNNVQMKGNVSW